MTTECAPLRRFQQFADERLIERLVVAADALDSPGIARATQALLRERGTIRTWTSVLVPLLQQIGGYWEREQDGVECEHLIADALQAVLLTRQSAAHSADAVLAATPTEGSHAAAVRRRRRACRTRPLRPSSGIGATGITFTAVDQLAPAALLLWARTHDATDAPLLASLRGRVPLLCAAASGAMTLPPDAFPRATCPRQCKPW